LKKNNYIKSRIDKAEYEKALELRDAGKFQETFNILEPLLTKYSQNAGLIIIAADMSYELGNIEKAIELFKQTVSLKPKSETASLGLFHSLWKMKRFDEAFEEMKRFMSVSYSQDYVEIVREINRKSDQRGRNENI